MLPDPEPMPKPLPAVFVFEATLPRVPVSFDEASADEVSSSSESSSSSPSSFLAISIRFLSISCWSLRNCSWTSGVFSAFAIRTGECFDFGGLWTMTFS